ncbi:hypothetical protein [Streptomyces sp. KL110A]|uniref:hypothetical protein n=1 Tax=Streptomyces sp. KL110A TaxID=3384221 RepID=UPI0038BF603D
MWTLLVGGATAAFFAGALGTAGLAIAIALTSSLSAVWTAGLENAAGRERRGPAA